MMSALDLVKDLAAKASLKSKPAQREAAIAKVERAREAKNKFEEDFMLVAEYFELEKHGEFDQALDVAKRDIANAKICYASIAASLRRDNTAAGITERIKTAIAINKCKTS